MKLLFATILPFLVLPFAAQARPDPAPEAAAVKRPNIVLYLSDDHGVDFVGCYGNRSVRTPNIDALAREGMKFNLMFAASPTCSPSRASMFTGLWPQRNGTMGNHTDCALGIPITRGFEVNSAATIHAKPEMQTSKNPTLRLFLPFIKVRAADIRFRTG